jgi:DNA-binding phage protein
MALKDIAKAHGVANVASESEVTREALYRTLWYEKFRFSIVS